MTSPRRSLCWLGAAGLPIAAAVIAFLVDVDPSRWRTLPAPMLRLVLADALLIEVLLLMIAAPLSGVLLRDRPMQLVIAAAISTTASGIGVLLPIGWRALPIVLPIVAAAHASLFAAALLFAALGAGAASRWRDPLDAAAISLGAALVITIGPFLAGPLAGTASAHTIDAVLAINPLVTTAAAADIDVLRMDTLYRLSPIAHRQFAYPSWPVSAGLFIGIAAALMLVGSRRRVSTDRLSHAS